MCYRCNCTTHWLLIEDSGKEEVRDKMRGVRVKAERGKLCGVGKYVGEYV